MAETTLDVREVFESGTYSFLRQYAKPLPVPEREIVGREEETETLLAAMCRPEICNALLLAPAGSGKTALVQSLSQKDTQRDYYELDLEGMLMDVANQDQLAASVKRLFDQVEDFVRLTHQEVVLFMDELHRLVQLSPPAVEALKPVLAASGARGIRVIAATTYEEFHQYIAANLPLVERLQRINLAPPDSATTVKILKGMAARYGVADQFYDDHIFEQIVQMTDRYISSSVQPRKSLNVLDAMVGFHRFDGSKLDSALMRRAIKASTNLDIAYRVDAAGIRDELDARVFSQKFATTALANRLHLVVAGMNNPSRPNASLLFTGSTGVGKTELAKQLARVMFGDDQNHMIRFDMTEFADDASMQVFREELTRRVWDMGHSVILLDEIEKASSRVVRLLLQVLDDGRMSDEHGRVVSFLNSYIVMTTNAGSEIYKDVANYDASDTGYATWMKEREPAIRRSLVDTSANNHFPPELLGRVDAIIPFQPLSQATVSKIVERALRQMVIDVARKHAVRVQVHPRVMPYLVRDSISTTDTDAGGARDALRKLSDEVLTAVAKFININPKYATIAVTIVGVQRNEDKELLRSDAYVQVEGVRGSERAII